MPPYEEPISLVRELSLLPTETEFVEFKVNNEDPEQIGRDICALANSAAYLERHFGYKVWGIDDVTHEIVGTTFDPKKARRGGQELELWLRLKLSQNTQFEFEEVLVDGRRLVLLRVWPAMHAISLFDGKAYIRSGSSTHELVRGSQRETELWHRVQHERYEQQVASIDVAADELAKYLDFGAYFTRQNMPAPQSQETALHYLEQEGLVTRQDNGLYSITNMGALLFARDMTEFSQVARKAPRVIQYEGVSRIVMAREREFARGYVLCLDEIVDHVLALLPSKTVIEGATRREQPQLPALAIREVVANALIHQDLGVTGAGPLIEIFANRVEVTNPGAPLVDIPRILNDPPRSRNERTASLLRRLNLCEEAGTGWDKTVAVCEMGQLPAPRIEALQNSTRVTLFAWVPFRNLTTEERQLACYWHACIKYANADAASNASLRERFGLSDSQSAQVSRLIKDCLERGLVRQLDPTASKKNMRYVPGWA